MMSSPKPRPRIGSALARIVFVFSVLLLALVIGVFVAGAAAIRSLKAPTETSTLHREMLNCLDASSRSSVEVTIPHWIAALGRVGVSLANVDPEVKAAVQAVGGGQVGVYELEERPPRHKLTALLDVADEELEREGWTRIVTVLDHEEFVAVYLADSTPGRKEVIEVFAVVMNQRELVMVSARGYPKPLMELATASLKDFDLQELRF